MPPGVHRALFEAAPDAIVVVDSSGRIVLANGHAQTMFGYSSDELIGASIEALIPARFRAAHPGKREHYLADPSVRAMGVGVDLYARRNDGSELPVEITLSHIQMSGDLLVSAAIRDITERKHAERALAEAQALARLGAWSWDASEETATWSAHTYKLFGRDPELGPAVGEALLAYAHAEDRERVAQHFGSDAGPGGEFELEFRIVTGRGDDRVLHAIGRKDPERPGAYQGTFQDLTDERRAEAAEAANRAKSQFMSRMSHELRTPLNAIIGFGQLLAMDDLRGDQAEHVGFVLKGANHLLALVDDVLDISRIEAGQMKISSEPVALGAMVADVVALVAPLAESAGVNVQVDSTGLRPEQHVHADARRLSQVMLNLLSNAIKYNRSGGRVEVSFEALDSGRVRTTVCDSGIGINPAHMHELFQPFERLGADERAIDGTGLGLALSKGLIEAMGGTIEASSAVGVGSSFVVELAGAPAPHADECPPGKDAGGSHVVSGTKVLYIEDNASNLKLAERVLARLGRVEMLSAMQGSIGLELAREHRPDAVILDLHLPDMDGQEVLKRLKADPRTRELPVIVLTADASKGLSKRLALLGASEFMQKPLDVPRFLDMIEAYVG